MSAGRDGDWGCGASSGHPIFPNNCPGPPTSPRIIAFLESLGIVLSIEAVEHFGLKSQHLWSLFQASGTGGKCLGSSPHPLPPSLVNCCNPAVPWEEGVEPSSTRNIPVFPIPAWGIGIISQLEIPKK